MDCVPSMGATDGTVHAERVVPDERCGHSRGPATVVSPATSRGHERGSSTMTPGVLASGARARTQVVPALAGFDVAVDDGSTSRSSLAEGMKQCLDRLLAGIALLVLAPLLVVLVIAVRVSSPGPVFYRHTRIGRNGRAFTFLKFRTMIADAHERREELLDLNECDGLLFKIRSDPRITGVGRWLRRLSLDELPQLWHVVTGHMSLVGPRPPLPTEVAAYSDEVWRRLDVKPGLTGLWQVSGRSNLSWSESVELDLWYVDNWSLWLDLSIMVRTVPAVLTGRGAY